MAKKRAKKQVENSAYKRYGVITDEGMREMADELKSAAAEMNKYADQVETERGGELQIDGMMKFENGMKDVRLYLGKVFVALRK